MTGSVRPHLELARRLLLVVLGIAALMRAQTAAPPRFDVASVKVNNGPFLETRPQRSGGRIRWTTDLYYLIGYAYRLQPWRMSGPVPGSDHIYDVEATTDPNATDDQVRLMLQSLLIDRFKMAAHRETRDVDGYALTVAKNGPRMQPAKEGVIPPLPEWASQHSGDAAQMEGLVVTTLPAAGVHNLIGRRVTMLQLSEALERTLSTAVFDETGLTDKYYFGLQYAAGDSPTEVPLPDLFSAIKELGLKLEKHRGPVEMLVVDHIEKTPGEN